MSLQTQVLSEHGGYTSYGVGKYHLGMMSEWALPTSRGFEKWDGYLQVKLVKMSLAKTSLRFVR